MTAIVTATLLLTLWWYKPRSMAASKLALPPDDLALITDIVSNGRDGLIVTERRGRVLEILLHEPPEVRLIADMQHIVRDGDSEYGMYSVALSPDYKRGGWLYLSFSNLDGDLEIGRYREADNRYEVVMVVEQPQIGDPVVDSTHKGGQLAFQEGYLYIATGDGGTRQPPQDNPAHDPTSLLGKILRIRVETSEGAVYTIPDDNPFVMNHAARGEVWLTGFRNPWKFSFDILTGDLYISDVGDAGFEEVNRAASGTAGVDFGWNCLEGNTPYYAGSYCNERPHEPPIHTYESHGTIAGRRHCAITGGELMRSVNYPHLFGSYVYGDVCAARLYQLRKAPQGWQSAVLYDFPDLQRDLITAIGMHNGVLYVANHTGDIYEMTAR